MKFPVPVKELEAFLPHRGPALWVDEVLWIDGKGGACGVRYDQHANYAQNGGLTETCFVEWVAQSFGFVKAAQAKVEDASVKIAQEAFLAAIRNYEIIEHPQNLQDGMLFEIEVAETHRLGPLTLIEGKIFCEKRLIASAQLKVFNR